MLVGQRILDRRRVDTRAVSEQSLGHIHVSLKARDGECCVLGVSAFELGIGVMREQEGDNRVVAEIRGENHRRRAIQSR